MVPKFAKSYFKEYPDLRTVFPLPKMSQANPTRGPKLFLSFLYRGSFARLTNPFESALGSSGRKFDPKLFFSPSAPAMSQRTPTSNVKLGFTFQVSST